MSEDVLAGLGAVELATGAPALRALGFERSGALEDLVFPADDGALWPLRYALTARLGVDPVEGIERIMGRGGGRLLAAELDSLAAVSPTLGGALRLRVAGAAALLNAGVRPAGAVAGDASVHALVRWAKLPFDRALGAYLALLAERPSLAGPVAGSWDPNDVLAAAAAWDPGARARLVELAGV